MCFNLKSASLPFMAMATLLLHARPTHAVKGIDYLSVVYAADLTTRKKAGSNRIRLQAIHVAGAILSALMLKVAKNTSAAPDPPTVSLAKKTPGIEVDSSHDRLPIPPERLYYFPR